MSEVSHPLFRPGAPTRIPRERRGEREVSPQICAHAGSGPLFPSSASLFLLPSSSSPRASCSSSAQRSSPPHPPKGQTTFWAKFRSEQERLSLPRLLLALALRNRKECAHSPHPPKELNLPVLPDFPCQKTRSGLKPPRGYAHSGFFQTPYLSLVARRRRRRRRRNKTKPTSKQNQPR